MAKPPYRVLYNQDNSNLFFVTAEPLTPEHVDRMVDEVADGGADALLLCPNAQRTSYPSAVWQPVWDGYRPGDPSFWGGRGHQIAAREHMVTQMRCLAERCDYVERALSRCAQRGIAPGISIRMNDMHDAPWPDSHLHSAFYQEHCEWHLRGQAGCDWGSVGLDYAHREVRDHLLALIGELAGRYRFELLELDFLRFAEYFDGTDPEGQRGTMTAFLHEVREVLSAASRPVALMAQIGALDRLRGAERRHPATVGVSNPATDLPVQVPVELGPRQSRSFRLLLARGVAGGGAAVAVELEGDIPPGALHLRMNDRPAGSALEVEDGVARFAVPADAVRDGVNELVLRIGAHAVTVHGIEVRFAADAAA